MGTVIVVRKSWAQRDSTKKTSKFGLDRPRQHMKLKTQQTTLGQ